MRSSLPVIGPLRTATIRSFWSWPITPIRSALVGTIEDDMASVPNVPMRERVRVYERAGFPNYPPADAEGYPARVDVSRRLALFSASLPDHYETFRPKLDNPNEPTVAGKDAGTYVANERYKNVPGSVSPRCRTGLRHA